MNQTDNSYSTQKISPQLISQIIDAIRNKHFGSVEIYIQNYCVTQITERTITRVTSPTTKKKIKDAQSTHQQTDREEISTSLIGSHSSRQ